ncbi:MAG TPA: hypothetical protein VGI39_12580 [Polyangiaceae bacterium]
MPRYGAKAFTPLSAVGYRSNTQPDGPLAGAHDPRDPVDIDEALLDEAPLFGLRPFVLHPVSP